ARRLELDPEELLRRAARLVEVRERRRAAGQQRRDEQHVVAGEALAEGAALRVYRRDRARVALAADIATALQHPPRALLELGAVRRAAEDGLREGVELEVRDLVQHGDGVDDGLGVERRRARRDLVAEALEHARDVLDRRADLGVRLADERAVGG